MQPKILGNWKEGVGKESKTKCNVNPIHWLSIRQ
jgi:hypothetical protein